MIDLNRSMLELLATTKSKLHSRLPDGQENPVEPNRWLSLLQFVQIFVILYQQSKNKKSVIFLKIHE
jgi:hypothetical protein